MGTIYKVSGLLYVPETYSRQDVERVNNVTTRFGLELKVLDSEQTTSKPTTTPSLLAPHFLLYNQLSRHSKTDMEKFIYKQLVESFATEDMKRPLIEVRVI